MFKGLTNIKDGIFILTVLIYFCNQNTDISQDCLKGLYSWLWLFWLLLFQIPCTEVGFWNKREKRYFFKEIPAKVIIVSHHKYLSIGTYSIWSGQSQKSKQYQQAAHGGTFKPMSWKNNKLQMKSVTVRDI